MPGRLPSDFTDAGAILTTRPGAGVSRTLLPILIFIQIGSPYTTREKKPGGLHKRPARGPADKRPGTARFLLPILVNKYNGNRTVSNGACRLPFRARADP